MTTECGLALAGRLQKRSGTVEVMLGMSSACCIRDTQVASVKAATCYYIKLFVFDLLSILCFTQPSPVSLIAKEMFPFLWLCYHYHYKPTLQPISDIV